uniref:Uncharacterized protein n=1 Tax=Anguilla anguilla TaxID=7936 RepID=A0A0E9U119_ANGAN
MILYIFTYTVV